MMSQSNAASANTAFDSETIELLAKIVANAWNLLTPTEQALAYRDRMAARVFTAASRGERDPQRLREAAVTPN